MSNHENFKDQTFLVTDTDARIRSSDDIWTYLIYTGADTISSDAAAGDFNRIPAGTEVNVREVRIVPAGKRHRFFADVESVADGTSFGWTSTTNFRGKFRNVTLGQIEPKPGAGRYAETAAWSGGGYIGQVTLVNIVDARLELERLTMQMADPYFFMVRAADKDGVSIFINSGFRTYSAQKYLYDNWKKGVSGFNLAAEPGGSKHQNGTALDIPVSGGPGSPVYDWDWCITLCA